MFAIVVDSGEGRREIREIGGGRCALLKGIGHCMNEI